jgi:ubiquinone/menaquinone biosynthesis C-methylase UbiE
MEKMQKIEILPNLFKPFLRLNNDAYLYKNIVVSLIPGDEQISEASLLQQNHYDKIYEKYAENLQLDQTREYTSYMDKKLLSFLDTRPLGNIAEICCGEGEAIKLLIDRTNIAIGVDISLKMLEKASENFSKNDNVILVHGDALNIPIYDDAMDYVFMLGGIHHVSDRKKLFKEVYRILKPGGIFIFREPASDWFLWKILRYVIYKFSSSLDEKTERPLIYEETVPVLVDIGFVNIVYRNFAFLGFCLFMNSDILKLNKIFNYLPGIRKIVRMFVKLDDFVTSINLFERAGLQVIGVAEKNS